MNDSSKKGLKEINFEAIKKNVLGSLQKNKFGTRLKKRFKL